eukprot:TRINITY_DN20872_c0_g1_i3.p1 TRINITY_DN20872_c0_g1~~TRINITY_DN20872_c0_g1_i3.p1  ORF type:complete len:457 (-),score=94.41 TRINITY_DN20872_c0_g1_i3:45-1415(-)
MPGSEITLPYSAGDQARTWQAQDVEAGLSRPRAKTTDTHALPDLKGRITDLGLLREYDRFSTDYLSWRKGGSKGAKGEITASALEGLRAFGLFTGYSDWQWRRTISYWVAIFFLEGSLLFTVTSFAGNEKSKLRDYYHPMTSWSVTPGGIFYILSTYLMCLETVNLKKQGAMTWWPIPTPDVLLQWKEMGLTSFPYAASITYFTGALIYFIPIVAGLVFAAVDPPHVLEVLLIQVPYIVAGALFTAGGLCETLDNGTFNSWPTTSAWWGALLNFIGGIFFFAAGIALPMSGWWCNVLFGIGSAVYTIGGAIMIIMWKDEQFGLTFLAALNHLQEGSCMEVSRPAAKERFFSLRSLLFLFLFVITAAISVINFSLTLEDLIMEPQLSTIIVLYNNFVPFLFLHLALVLCSAVVRMPKATPYKQLMVGLRILMILVALGQIARLVAASRSSNTGTFFN